MANIANKTKTFTAKVIIPNQAQPRYIPNATIYKGKIVALIEVGEGKPQYKAARNMEGDFDEWEEYKSYKTKMKPYLSVHLMGDRKQYFSKILDKDKYLTDKNEAELLEVSFVMGENQGGYIVSNMEVEQNKLQEEREKKVANKEIPLIIIGYSFGFSISERLPSDVWSKLKPYAKYWSASDIDEWFDDMDDFHKIGEGKYMKGWYYTKEIIPILQGLGFTLEQK